MKTPLPTLLLSAVVVAGIFSPSVGFARLALNASFGPSFSCKANLTELETSICNDVELSEYDKWMADLYLESLADPIVDEWDSPFKSPDLKTAQRNWVRSRPTGDVEALKVSYRQRITELADLRLQQIVLSEDQNGRSSEETIRLMGALELQKLKVSGFSELNLNSAAQIAYKQCLLSDFSNDLNDRIEGAVGNIDGFDETVNELMHQSGRWHASNVLLATELLCYGLHPAASKRAMAEVLTFYLENWAGRFPEGSRALADASKIDFDSCDYAYLQFEINACQAEQYAREEKEALLASINDWDLDTDLSNPLLAEVIQQSLDPKCFEFGWWSGDNLEEYETFYSLENSEINLFSEPGKAFGGRIPTPAPIPFFGETYTITPKISECAGFEGEVAYIDLEPGEEPGGRTPFEKVSYRGVIPVERCPELFPNLPNSCESIFEVEYQEYGGGSMISPPEIGISAILNWGGERVLAPAKY